LKVVVGLQTAQYAYLGMKFENTTFLNYLRKLCPRQIFYNEGTNYYWPVSNVQGELGPYYLLGTVPRAYEKVLGPRNLR
jgi:hypothetical protein